MAETLTASSIAPSFLDFSQRRLPQPIQLPPLSIPPGSPRSEYRSAPAQTQHLPAINSATAVAQRPPPPQPRAYPGPAAPLDKLLSPQPYTPPRSENVYSSPPRSAIDTQSHSRRSSQKYGLEEPARPVQLEQPYVSPIEPYRQSSAALPSPTSYVPSYAPPRPVYGQPAAPPHLPGPASFAPPYPEHLPPPSRMISGPAQHGPQPEPLDLHYRLIVRQQPIAARACGFGERDRRVIDPPPIIQLEVYDPKSGTVDLDELRYSLNVVHCTLWNAEGTSEETALIQPDRRATRRLMGQLVASPSVAKDEHDVEGCFFCFPDLSCRTHGKYRLRFVLMRIDPHNLHVGGFSPILTDVLSDVFTVYTAKDFPGMRPSSALTRALKLQGCNIQVKKGNEKALAARKRASMSTEEGEAAAAAAVTGALAEDDNNDPHKAKKRRKE